MKVILLRDVAKIGRRSEIVEVPNGYARNQLIPKGMAEPASAANMKKIQKMNVEHEAATAKATEGFTSAMSLLKDKTVTVAVDLNEKNHAFKAVSEDEIVAAAKEMGVDISSAMIKISAPIKEGGEHVVVLHSGAHQAEFKVEVVKK
jgi:large subunit ribosomal protein L9